jgi:hypothetical protein
MGHNFRIVIGSGCCTDDAVIKRYGAKFLCEGVNKRIEKIKSMELHHLIPMPEESYEEEEYEGKKVHFSTYNIEISDDERLVVVQAFINTWKWPTYISFGAVGHLVAEGVIINKNGTVVDAPEEELWGFR